MKPAPPVISNLSKGANVSSGLPNLASMHAPRILGALVALLLALVPAAARGATLQSVGAFDQPIFLSSDPDSGERLFVVEREGRIVQVVGGAATVFADLRPVVQCNGACSGERGLLSIALAPDFASSGRLYVDYAKGQDGTIHVAELRAGPSEAPLSSLRNVLTIPHPGESNHNGGQLQFGPDGYLYVSTGDGGGADDVHHNAQDLGSLLGKILRIDPRATGILPYSVPFGNPFPAAPAPADTIWSYGLRNPFRFSFDRVGGAMVIGDVGQKAREEIDAVPRGGGAGVNYGWNCREGTIAGPATDAGCEGAPPSAFSEPVFDYPHTELEPGGPKRCAIIGGYVVHDPGLLELANRYLYGDLCTGEIRSVDLASPATNRPEGLEVPGLNSFGEDACGRVYAISGAGQVSRIVGAQATPCPPAPSFIRIRALRRRVPRGRRAVIAAFLSPCPLTRRGTPVKLFRGRRAVGTRRLDRACTTRFTPRISRRAAFHATIGADGISAAASSRRLTIRPIRGARGRR
jgi:hypothetical protein